MKFCKMRIDSAVVKNHAERMGPPHLWAALPGIAPWFASRTRIYPCLLLILVCVSLPAANATLPEKGWRLQTGPQMALAPMPITPTHLATALFGEVTSLASSPTDSVYADCLLSQAFSDLLSGLTSPQGSDPVALAECADAIEECRWLTDTVRTHVSRTLRDASNGRTSIVLAHQVMTGAAQRTLHQMATELARSSGGDGAAFVTDALDGVAASIAGAKR